MFKLTTVFYNKPWHVVGGGGELNASDSYLILEVVNLNLLYMSVECMGVSDEVGVICCYIEFYICSFYIDCLHFQKHCAKHGKKHPLLKGIQVRWRVKPLLKKGLWFKWKFSRMSFEIFKMKEITILLKLISTYCWKLQLRWVMWPTGIFLIYWNKTFMYDFFKNRFVARLEEVLHEWKLVNHSPLPPAPRVCMSSMAFSNEYFISLRVCYIVYSVRFLSVLSP